VTGPVSIPLKSGDDALPMVIGLCLMFSFVKVALTDTTLG